MTFSMEFYRHIKCLWGCLVPAKRFVSHILITHLIRNLRVAQSERTQRTSCDQVEKYRNTHARQSGSWWFFCQRIFWSNEENVSMTRMHINIACYTFQLSHNQQNIFVYFSFCASINTMWMFIALHYIAWQRVELKAKNQRMKIVIDHYDVVTFFELVCCRLHWQQHFTSPHRIDWLRVFVVSALHDIWTCL